MRTRASNPAWSGPTRRVVLTLVDPQANDHADRSVVFASVFTKPVAIYLVGLLIDITSRGSRYGSLIILMSVFIGTPLAMSTQWQRGRQNPVTGAR